MNIALLEGQEVYDIDGNKYLTEASDCIILKENSLQELKDVDLVHKLIEFIKTNPFPVDDDFHNFAKENNVDPDKMEQYAYALLSIFFTGGASKGYVIEASNDNLSIGQKIEQEHVSLDYETNDVVSAMQECIANKIKYDHLSENPNYYVDGVDFVKELESESITEGTYDNGWWKKENPDIWKSLQSLIKKTMKKYPSDRSEAFSVGDKFLSIKVSMSSLRFSLVEDAIEMFE